jgi:CDP-glycerol glycerophosphotransferase
LDLNEGHQYSKTDPHANSSDDTIHCVTSRYWSNLRGDRDRNLKVTGFPKNDTLVHPPKILKKKWHNFTHQSKLEIENVILYAPSKRRPERWSIPTSLFPYQDMSGKSLHNFLQSQRLFICIHLHPADIEGINGGSSFYDPLRNRLESLQSSSDRVVCTNNRYKDINNLMPFADALITDYSSVMFDYLLTDCPIYQIPWDYERVHAVNAKINRREDQYVFNFDNDFPGPKLKSYDIFKRELSNLSKCKHEYSVSRRKLSNRVHKHEDNQSSARIVELANEFMK